MAASADTEAVMTCEACGATILEQHIKRQLAGLWGGKMLCPHCYREQTQKAKAEMGGGDDPGGTQMGRKTVKVGDELSHDLDHYRRPLNATGQGATRVHTFHTRLTEGAVAHLDHQINAWIDTNPDVEIKFATTTVGNWEGKHGGPSIIMTVFY